MNEAVKVAFQLHSDRLRDEAQAKNDDSLNKLDENIQKIIKEQVKVQVSKILPKIEKTVNEQLEAEVLTRASNSSKTSYVVAADLFEMELKKIIIEKMKSNKSIHRSDKKEISTNLWLMLMNDKDKEPFAGSDRGSKRRRAGKEPESTNAPKEKASKTSGKSTEGSKSHQKTTSESVPAEKPMQTTQDLEVPPHQEFKTGVADDKHVAESSLHLEWFQKQAKPPTPDCAWNKTLPATHKSIQPWISDLAKQADSRTSFNELMDTHVDFSAYLMNRLKVDTLTPKLLAGPTYELMKGSCNSLTKAADYGHIKGIKDLFNGFVANRESGRYVYSKRRIIAVTELQIVEWNNYKHLDWITIRKDDDKLYKFKESDLKRLRIQDIKDMLLLSVQGKLTNLTVEERFAFNVSLRMFTRSIVIQRHVEDLQLDVKSYQNKINLTKPDTYRSDLKRKEAYTAYSNPRGFIYQNKDKQKRLMHIDELHKFSDGTLNDVRTALDDRLKGIRMKTLKDEGKGTCFQLSQRFIAACSYPTINDEVLKLKNFKKDASKSSQVIKIKKGVRTEEVDLASKIVGCSTFSSPFTYLGVKVDGVMSRIKMWDDVISKVYSQLSKQKLKTLSIEGVLGVSSFFAFNRALLFKWVWRFLTQPSSLWVRFIKAIYGDKGAIDFFDSISRPSPWLDIIHESSSLTNKGIDFMAFVRKKVGNGEDSLFWEDNWLNNMVLKHHFPRLFALESSKQITVVDKLKSKSLDTSYRRAPRGGIEEEQQQLLRSHIEGIILAPMLDRWVWSYEASVDFSLKSIRNFIDDVILPKENVPTRWCRSMADLCSHDSGYKWKLLAQTLLDIVEEPRPEGIPGPSSSVRVKIHNYWRGLEGSGRTHVLFFPTNNGDPGMWEVKIHNYWRGLEGSGRTHVLFFPTNNGDPGMWEA
nr:RNA-directed DNA polymerase, eukaryota, reverse transcriptase zinc-binding domain protein [Tanacetum cinerariifolium]